jgi:hypothetical protein
VLLVGGTLALALGGVLVAHKAFPKIANGPFEDMAEGLRVVYELVFALILAFVIASVLDTFSQADSTVASEATTLAHMKRANQALPVQQQLRLDDGLYQYVHAIVEDEWETMREGEASPRAAASLETLYALYQSYSPPPAEGPEAEFYRLAVDELDEASSARRSRLNLSAAELPSLLRVFLPIGALLLLMLEYRPKMPLRAQLVHMGLLATVVSFCLMLTVLLDYPFAGEITVSNDPFKQGALGEFWSDENPHVLRPGETQKDLSHDELGGVWNSAAFGVLVLREVGDEIHGVYRLSQGTVVGRVSDDGVFRGWWCQGPSRQPPNDAGDVEWTLVETPEGDVVYGSWRTGTQGPFAGGWDLIKVGGPEPPDLAPRFDDPSAFCRHP